MSEAIFELAGAELDWPIGSAAGMTNHPDIDMVANRLQGIVETGVAFAVGGSWTLGDERGGSAYTKTPTGWEYRSGDEYVDPEAKAGYNAKALPNPGTDKGMERLNDLIAIAARRNVEFGLSLSPHSGNPVEELRELKEIARVALKKGVLYVEFNLSCPNIEGRPPFYLDTESVMKFYDDLKEGELLLNRYGRPGAYLKWGPYKWEQFDPFVHCAPESVGGHIISNTKGNQIPLLEDGSQAIKVNNGKAGMSGPALKELGRMQLDMWRITQLKPKKVRPELIRALGVDDGQEIKTSLDLGAKAVQLGSLLYWPKEMRGLDTAAEVVEQIKKEFVEATQAA